MEKFDIYLRIKGIYEHEIWKRRTLLNTENYRPHMIKRSALDMFCLESSEAVNGQIGSYETIWSDKENKNRRIRITVIPFESMNDADECIIERLSTITSILPRFDKGEDDDRVIFGYPSHILIGRERNVYWSIQNISIESVELSQCVDEVMRVVKNE